MWKKAVMAAMATWRVQGGSCSVERGRISEYACTGWNGSTISPNVLSESWALRASANFAPSFTVDVDT